MGGEKIFGDQSAGVAGGAKNDHIKGPRAHVVVFPAKG
jgi:hypothetical protein